MRTGGCGTCPLGSTSGLQLRSVRKKKKRRTHHNLKRLERSQKARKPDIIKRQLFPYRSKTPTRCSYNGRNKPASIRHWKTWPPMIPNSRHTHICSASCGFSSGKLQSSERRSAQLTLEPTLLTLWRRRVEPSTRTRLSRPREKTAGHAWVRAFRCPPPPSHVESDLPAEHSQREIARVYRKWRWKCWPWPRVSRL